MSADRWSECLKCAAQEQAKIDELEKTLRDGYGQLSLDDFRRVQEKLAGAKFDQSMDPETTLREDWNVGTPLNGAVIFEYSAGCSVCGFSFSAERIITLTGSEDPS